MRAGDKVGSATGNADDNVRAEWVGSAKSILRVTWEDDAGRGHTVRLSATLAGEFVHVLSTALAERG